MAELSTEQAASARKINAVLLQRLASVGGRAVAESLGISESTVSRWKDGDLERMAQTLSVLGLKVVPVSHQCFAPGYVEALKMLARQALDGADPVQGE